MSEDSTVNGLQLTEEETQAEKLTHCLKSKKKFLHDI